MSLTQTTAYTTAASSEFVVVGEKREPNEQETNRDAKEVPVAATKLVSAINPSGVQFGEIPIFGNLLHKRQWQLEHMAGAFRVFARKGYTEGTSGHISVRDPINPDTFWINPLGYHFDMLKASDMVHVDETGNIIGGNPAAVNVAGFMIHSSIHKARKDVHAACHTHSVHGKAWSTFGKPLDIINQDACSFWNNHVVYKTFGGMVLELEEGERIAKALGPHSNAAILQNHGYAHKPTLRFAPTFPWEKYSTNRENKEDKTNILPVFSL